MHNAIHAGFRLTWVVWLIPLGSFPISMRWSYSNSRNVNRCFSDVN